MDSSTVAKVAMRVVALMVFIQSVMALPSLLQFLSRSDESLVGMGLDLYITGLFAPLIMAAIVWALAPKLGSWAVGKLPSADAQSALNATSLQSIAFITLGTYLVIESVPYVVGFIAATITLMHHATDSLQTAELPAWYNTRFYVAVFKLIFGLALIAGSKRLTQVLHAFRYFGFDADVRK